MLQDVGKNSGENVISAGKYIIINKKKFSKLHLLTENSNVYLGKDKVELNGVIGHSFWSTFKMVPKKSKREFFLEPCTQNDIIESENELFKNKTSGQDNRNIWDDGNSQLLTTDKIVELRDSGLSSQAIVERLIENSKTFHSKSEYSQEKYLKKKGSKYFEYVTIKKPTIRILSELFYSKDPTKVLGLRTDSLSQIVTAVNLQPDGRYLLYENGSQGLVAATILNHLSDNGKLVYVSSGKFPQKHAILAMNFNEKLNQLKCIQLSALLQNCDQSDENKEGLTSKPSDNDCLNKHDYNISNDSKQNVDFMETNGKLSDTHVDNVPVVETDASLTKSESQQLISYNLQKRKNDDSSYEGTSDAKKARWELDAEQALNLANSKNLDGLVIVCKEYPLNLLLKLMQYLSPSRPFIVFSLYREVLSQLYVELKLRHSIINLRMTETWLRSYQVLPDRTHPDVLMTGNSGFLLTGIIVNNV